MNTQQNHKTIYSILLICLFIVIESGGLAYIYKVEEKNFRQEIETVIQNSIEEESHRITSDKTDFYFYMRDNYTAIMSYKHAGQSFYIDSVPSVVVPHFEKAMYDFNHPSFSIDSLASYFHRRNPFPAFPITFIRRDASGQLIDRHPANSPLPRRLSDLPAYPLGNIHADTLTADFRLPAAIFLQRQRAGLSITLLLLLPALLYGILILRKAHIERNDRMHLKKQIIFIHDLKTPLCTNRDITQRTLLHADAWERDKILQKNTLTDCQARRLLQETEAFVQQTPDRRNHPEECTPTALRQTLETTIARHAATARQPIRLECRLPETPLPLPPFHLAHMVDNLLTNALHHGSATDCITLSCHPAGRNRIAISVTNRTAPHSPARHGHGVGLAYIRQTLRRHGGRLRTTHPTRHHTTHTLLLPTGKPSARRWHTPLLYPAFTSLVLATLGAWGWQLYSAEQQDFFRRQREAVTACANSVNMLLLQWREDTAYFENNREAQSVTVIREGRDTTLPIGGHTDRMELYTRLAYDLRGPRWSPDSIARSYRLHAPDPQPAHFRVTNRDGKPLAATTSATTLPLAFRIPLGYVEGHHLEVRMAFPPLLPLQHNAPWILLSALAAALLAWFTLLLHGYDHRRRAFLRFQQEKAQHFLRGLQTDLRQVVRLSATLPPVTALPLPALREHLRQKLALYERLLRKTNLLLDQIAAFQNL